MIHAKNGRSFSEQTRAEIEELLKQEFNRLTPDERRAVELLLKGAESEEVTTEELLGQFAESHYLRPPVDMETFILDDYYLGLTCRSIFPKLLEDLKEVFAGDYNEVIFTGGIGVGKCVAGDTEIFDVAMGKRSLVRNLTSLRVQSFSSDGSAQISSATAFPSGHKECVRLTLRNGSAVELSTDHPVLTGRGWIHAQDVLSSDLVATPRHPALPEVSLEVSDDVVTVVGYLLADGGCTGRTPTFTNMNPVILRDYVECTERLADRSRMRDSSLPSASVVKNPNTGQATTYRSRGMLGFMDEYDLRHKSTQKRVPAEFYGLPLLQVALLLNRIWACDGCLNLGNRTAEIGLASEGLIKDIQFLLHRLGVVSRYARRRKFYTHKGERRSSLAYVLIVSECANVLRFLDALGDIKGKELRSAELRAACLSVIPERESTNTDVVPVDRARYRQIFEELGSKGKGLRNRFRLGGKHLSRSRFSSLVAETGYDGEWAWYARSDIRWERVKGVMSIGTREVFDLNVPGDHNFVANGIVVHNTFACSIGVCRVLYELSCLRSPQESYGLAPDTPISIAGFSVNEDLAKEVVLKNVVGKIGESPYFKEHFSYKITQKNIRFPNNVIMVSRATTARGALGMSLLAAILDESNFLPVKKGGRLGDVRFGAVNMAKEIYDSITRRIKSRYGRNGKLFLPSSKSTQDSFLNGRIQAADTDPTIFVRDYALWDVKPGDYSEKTFWVLCGNEQIHSTILDDPKELERIQNDLPDRTVLIEVPDDFEPDFRSDLEGAIRDVAGVSTVSISPFIQRTHTIGEIFNETREVAFSHDVYDPSVGGSFLWSRMVQPVKIRGANGFEMRAIKPKLNPGAPRHVHIDPALNNCSAGFAMAHIGSWTTVERLTQDRKRYSEHAPFYVVDVALQITPPTGGELDFEMYRQLIYQLADHGYHITRVTMDSWQCLAAGTRVNTSRGLIPIEEVEPGDVVESRIGPSPVLNTWCFGERTTLRIETTDGHVLEGTEHHRIEGAAVSGFMWEWRRLEELKLGDVIRTVSEMRSDFGGAPSFTRVKSIEKSRAVVYDLEIQDDPSYVANGIVNHNSVDMLQQLHKKGFETGLISMDKTWDPYQNLKQSIYEHRLSCYPYIPLKKELIGLEADWEKRKINKPESGSKDISDAVAGVCYSLLHHQSVQPMLPMKGLRMNGDAEEHAWMAEQQHAMAAGKFLGLDGTDPFGGYADIPTLPPFLTGGNWPPY